MEQYQQVSKMISLILRHRPEFIGANLDESGWLEVEVLINGINQKGMALTKELLIQLVHENDKQRFILSEDGLNIRANQGHSVEVDLKLQATVPPAYLFHGTVEQFLTSIRENGLLKMKRQHVHLSQDLETALKVGARRGKPVILKVMATKMQEEGHTFYRSENGVWLTEKVEPKYLVM